MALLRPILLSFVASILFLTARAQAACTSPRRIVRVGAASEVCAPLPTNFRAAGNAFEAGAVDPDRRSLAVDLEQYNNERTDDRTYDDGGMGWSSVMQTASALEAAGSSLRVLGNASDLTAGGTSPAVQVIVNEVIGPAETPALATFLLPPHWRADGRYPILLTANGQGVNNNTRLFRTAGPTDVFLQMLQATTGGRTGLIVAIVNAGGREAVGLSQAALENVGRVVARAAELGGDPNRVIAWGGSRGGLTALVYGANPLNAPFKVIAVFGQVPYPEMGTTCTRPFSVSPGLLGLTPLSLGAEGTRYDRFPTLGTQAPNEVCRRIMGHAQWQDADAHSGSGFVDRLAAARAAGSLRFVVTSYGSKDPTMPYDAAHRYQQALERAGVPATMYVALGAGHEGSGRALSQDLSSFVADLTLPAPRGFVPKAGRSYTVADPQADAQAPVTPAYTPFSARLPFREVAGHETMIELVGASGGDYAVELRRGTQVIKRWAGRFAVDEHLSERFPTPPAGTYQWDVRWRGRAMTRLPFTGDALTFTSTATQPSDAQYWADPRAARAFGVDEVTFLPDAPVPPVGGSGGSAGQGGTAGAGGGAAGSGAAGAGGSPGIAGQAGGVAGATGQAGTGGAAARGGSEQPSAGRGGAGATGTIGGSGGASARDEGSAGGSCRYGGGRGGVAWFVWLGLAPWWWGKRRRCGVTD